MEWARGNCIGKGSFGTVSLAVKKSSGRIFAVKSVNSTSLPSQVEFLENEIQILQSLSSPYVVQYLGDDVTQESPTTSYRNLHMEYMSGGTVAELGAHFGRKDTAAVERIVRLYTRCIVSALRYIHSMGIVHCDVKGRNVLVGSTSGVAKLADFGSAKRISGDAEVFPRGTPLWMAPEVVRQELQGPESDVWSLGCTVIEMVTGKPAWQDSGVATMFRISFSDELPEFPSQLSETGRDFLEKCLRREPSERWSCEQLLRHPFISENIVTESSPRSILDCLYSEFCDYNDEDEEEIQFSFDCKSHNSNSSSEEIAISAKDRIRKLASDRGVLWESDGWEVVRPGSVCDRGEAATATASAGAGEQDRGGTSLEYSNFIGTTEERERASWEYSNFMSSSSSCSCRGEIEGIRWEFLGFVGGIDGKWLSYVTRAVCWNWSGCRAGLGCQYGLQLEKREWKCGVGVKKREKCFYSCCKLMLLLLLFHLMKILRFYLVFLSVTLIKA